MNESTALMISILLIILFRWSIIIMETKSNNRPKRRHYKNKNNNILKILKRPFCKKHKFKRYECVSDNFTSLGWTFSECIHCSKTWGNMTQKEFENAEYIDSGISV